MSEIQGLVDALAEAIARPVGVDDRRFRAVAYSSHMDGVDPVRVASILQREAPHEVTAWLESLGIREADGVVRVPANRAFGMAMRVCIPVRFDGMLLGYLWLIDEPEALSDLEIDEALSAAQDLGLALYRARRLEHEDRERERDVLRQLVGRRDGDPIAAAEELIRDGFLVTAVAYGVLVLQAFHESGEEMPDAVRVRLAAAAAQLRRGVAPRHLLVLVVGEQAVCVLACAAEQELERRGTALAAAAAHNLADSPGWTALVGVSDEHRAARELSWAYDEASQALRVGHAIGGQGPLVRWSGLGTYRMLEQLRGDRDRHVPLPQAFERLRTSPDASMLLATLECYLDLGGDARAAAQALSIHRSSLYGRLHRIEEIAGANLHSGEDRLELHLALRLWRLSGRHR